MTRLVTIGVYGFTAETFLDTLAEGGVGLLLDLRQRRGVRGPDYSWANSTRLQRSLDTANIGYCHAKELAPTTELRQLQYREDHRQGVGKRNRIALAPAYVERYTREILDPFDLAVLVAELPTDSTIALFCVERDPQACHRSLVAARLHGVHGLPVTDLRAALTPLPDAGAERGADRLVSEPVLGGGGRSALDGDGCATWLPAPP